MPELGVHIELSEHSHRAPAGHPENAIRLDLITKYLNNCMSDGRMRPVVVTEHEFSRIEAVHDSAYLRKLEETCDAGGGYLDPDTYVTSGSFGAARRVVDASLSAVDAVIERQLETAFVLGRPPGHHAEHDRAMGFCLINSVAVAAQYLVDKYELNRVAVVDFDVHHANGTQHMFYDRSDVYVISTHQYPFYPGTGAASETGTGDGKGFTLNIPMDAGDGDRELMTAFEREIVPALNRYRPQFVLISAGFDAHHLDPLGGMMITKEGFGRIAAMLAGVAREHSEGRLVSVLEGGYNSHANLEAITSYLNGLIAV